MPTGRHKILTSRRISLFQGRRAQTPWLRLRLVSRAIGYFGVYGASLRDYSTTTTVSFPRRRQSLRQSFPRKRESSPPWTPASAGVTVDGLSRGQGARRCRRPTRRLACKPADLNGGRLFSRTVALAARVPVACILSPVLDGAAKWD